jgi:hypothetical protein
MVLHQVLVQEFHNQEVLEDLVVVVVLLVVQLVPEQEEEQETLHQ